jgi:hypothetical protein
MACRSILALPAAGLGFFFSALVLKLGLNSVNDDLGINNLSYVMSMYVTLILWVVIAPAVGVMVRAQLVPMMIRTRRAGRSRIIDVD